MNDHPEHTKFKRERHERAHSIIEKIIAREIEKIHDKGQMSISNGVCVVELQDVPQRLITALTNSHAAHIKTLTRILVAHPNGKPDIVDEEYRPLTAAELVAPKIEWRTPEQAAEESRKSYLETFRRRGEIPIEIGQENAEFLKQGSTLKLQFSLGALDSYNIIRDALNQKAEELLHRKVTRTEENRWGPKTLSEKLNRNTGSIANGIK